jgi:hypothetical protein
MVNRKSKGYCRLVFCHRCGERIHKGNGYYRNNGMPLNPCKQCTVDLTTIYKWARLGIDAITIRETQLKRESFLLQEAKKHLIE